MAKEKIIITGANGQVGCELRIASSAFPQFECVFLTKEQLSIDRPVDIRQFFEKHQPAYCINCAAYTAVDKAETEPQTAYLVNAESAGHLAAECQSVGTRLVQISTDYVFDGTSSLPLREEDPTGPINTYGASKLKGEMLVTQNSPDAIIVRTSWVYSEFGNNFVKTMIRLLREKQSINVIDDQVGSPTYAADLATTILEIISIKPPVPGIYHYSNEGKISWYEFALVIGQMIGSSCTIHPIPASQYPTLARRPAFSLLDKTKIQSIYGIQLMDWKASLSTCIGKILKKE